MFNNVTLQESGGRKSEMTAPAIYITIAAIMSLCAALIATVMFATKAKPDLANLALEKLTLSGVENPVTAVLLNFRSYDTLLEIAVLMIVAVAMLPTLSASGDNASPTAKVSLPGSVSANPVLVELLKWLVPLAILMGGYLLWTGAYAPGGAFQAGAVIAGAGVALAVAGSHQFTWQSTIMRSSLSIGLFVFVLVAAINAAITGTTLQYPQDHAGMLILVVEIAATLSIASILLLLFVRLNSMVSPDQEDYRS